MRRLRDALTLPRTVSYQPGPLALFALGVLVLAWVPHRFGVGHAVDRAGLFVGLITGSSLVGFTRFAHDDGTPVDDWSPLAPLLGGLAMTAYCVWHLW